MWRPLVLSTAALLFLLHAAPTAAVQYHPPFVNFTAPPGVLPGGIEWDGAHGCYLLSSSTAPVLYRLFDRGQVYEFAREQELPPGAGTAGLFVDYPRQRVLAIATGGSSSSTLLAYDLVTGKRQMRIPLGDSGSRDGGGPAAVPGGAAQVAVDAATGDAYVATRTTPGAAAVWKVPFGAASAEPWLPLLAPAGGSGDGDVGGRDAAPPPGGLVYHQDGLLLLGRYDGGGLFRVALRAAAAAGPPEALQVALNETLPGVAALRQRPDGRIVALSSAMAWLLESADSWQTAAIRDRVALGGDGSATDVALRNGLAYVLHRPRPPGGGTEGKTSVVYTEFPSEAQKEPWLLLGICTVVLVIVLLLRFQIPYLIREQMKKRA